MASALINMKQPITGRIKSAPVGFSWTTLLFGPFPALLRGHILMALVIAVTNFITFGIAGIVWAFIYNGLYMDHLEGRGFVADK